MYSQPALKAIIKPIFEDQLTSVDQAASIDDISERLATLIFNTQDILANGGFIPNSSQPATPVGGCKIYAENGALKCIGSSGTVTLLASA